MRRDKITSSLTGVVCSMRVFVPDDTGAPALFRLAAQERVQVRHLRASVPTLEDVFAKAVGEK